jgi:hypothetical protein
MLLKNSSDRVKVQAPPVFRDTAIVRVVEHKFGPSKKDNPMITLNLELAGVPNTTGGIETEVKVGGQRYKIAGLRMTPVWFTLKEGYPLEQYEAFWKAANPGLEFPGVDTENPDRSFLDNLAMFAVVRVSSKPRRKHITDEEKAAKQAEGKEPIGDPILDADGNEILDQEISVDRDGWLKKYTGELPPSE